MATPSPRPTTREYAKYYFDELMGKGLVGLLLFVFVGTALILLVITPLLWGLTKLVTGEGTPGELPGLYWQQFVTVFKLGKGEGAWTEQFAALLLALLAILFSGAIFGAVVKELSGRTMKYRDQGGRIVAQGHTVILGWSDLGHRLLTELAAANENQRNAVVAILTAGGKVRTEEEIAHDAVGDTRVIVRPGKLNKSSSFDLVRLSDASKVVVVGNWGTPTYDEDVITTLLALARYREAHPEFSGTVVACLVDSRDTVPAQVAAKYATTILDVRRVLSRIMLQMCLQPGLYHVYSDLLDFDGDELYFTPVGPLAGSTFGEALTAFPTSAPIGLRSTSGVQLHPGFETVLAAGDDLVVITADDDTAVVGPPATITETALVTAPTTAVTPGEVPATAGMLDRPTRWLFIGWSETLPDLLSELDAYCHAPATVEVLVAESDRARAELVTQSDTTHVALTFRTWPREYDTLLMLGQLDVASHDFIIIFNQSQNGAAASGDASTLLILLHLRQLLGPADNTGQPVVITELLDESYRKIADSADARDMVVSSEMVAMMLAQLTETPDLLPIFEDLWDAEGSEVYLKPADRYVTAGTAVTFATVVAAARSRGEIAIGYRLAGQQEDRASRYGVHLNPRKDEVVTLTTADRVIVVSADDRLD